MSTEHPEEVSVLKFSLLSILQMTLPYVLFISSGITFWYVSVVPVFEENKINYDNQTAFIEELKDVIKTNSEAISTLIRFEIQRQKGP